MKARIERIIDRIREMDPDSKMLAGGIIGITSTLGGMVTAAILHLLYSL